jgi:hypothetical protein
VWIKHGLKPVEEAEGELNNSDKFGHLVEVSFGYLPSTAVYSWNKKIQNYNLLKWQTNIREKYLAIKYQTNELRLNQECLDNYFVVSTAYAGIHMLILPLKAPPRCYILPRRPGQYHKRTLEFGMIDRLCLADSSALCLQFRSQNTLGAFAEFLINVIKLDCHTGSINSVEMSGQSQHFNQNLSDFWSNYAYQMLLALGYRMKHQLTFDTHRKIVELSNLSRGKQYSNHECYLKLMAIYYRARHNRFFDINKEFDSIRPIPSSVVLDKWEYVPRVYLTPYGIFPLPIKPMRGNRILRERQSFGPSENFCRVIIRDVDLGQPQNDFMKINERWIKDLIIGDSHIIVGDRPFHFLLCSNSQLRDRSFWFHASFNGRGADHIRQWMGDFSSEKCIGTRIARMALSLTGTTATITVKKNHIS